MWDKIKLYWRETTIGILAVSTAWFAWRASLPPELQIQTKEIEVEKVVFKDRIVEVEKVVFRDRVIKEKTTKLDPVSQKPTEIVEREETDKETSEESTTDEQHTSERMTETKKETLETHNQSLPNWHIGLSGSLDKKVGLSVDYRLFGSFVFIGGFADEVSIYSPLGGLPRVGIRLGVDF